MSKEFIGIAWGTDKIKITTPGPAIEGRPIEIHSKDDGTIDNRPSFAIVTEVGNGFVISQISLDMFNGGLADIGYKLVKIE